MPEGKRVLNTHIADDEYDALKAEAKRRRMTMTMVLRLLIRDQMNRTRLQDREEER